MDRRQSNSVGAPVRGRLSIERAEPLDVIVAVHEPAVGEHVELAIAIEGGTEWVLTLEPAAAAYLGGLLAHQGGVSTAHLGDLLAHRRGVRR